MIVKINLFFNFKIIAMRGRPPPCSAVFGGAGILVHLLCVRVSIVKILDFAIFFIYSTIYVFCRFVCFLCNLLIYNKIQRLFWFILVFYVDFWFFLSFFVKKYHIFRCFIC